MKHLTATLGLAVAATLAAPAMAADLPPAPDRFTVAPVAATPDWSGFWLGAYIGAGAARTDIEAGPFAFDGIGSEGLIGGAMFGYDHQLGDKFVVGLQGEIGLSGIGSELSGPGFSVEASPEYVAAAGLRAGYLVTETALLYAIGGGSWTELTVDFPGGSASQEYFGWFAGTGIEAMITEHMAARVEYRFTQYGGENWGINGLDVEPSAHTGRLGVAWRF